MKPLRFLTAIVVAAAAFGAWKYYGKHEPEAALAQAGGKGDSDDLERALQAARQAVERALTN